MTTTHQFKFRSSDRIGSAAAEDDYAFLVSCFVDNGQFDELVKGDLQHHIVLGRTGAGKTALLQRLEDKHVNVIRLDPEQLALNYLTNNTVLQFLVSLGVDLDLFFMLLWRHVMVVEVLRIRFRIRDEESKRHFFSVFETLFQTPKQQRALEYLDQWGGSFWLETDARVKEVTGKLESDVKAVAGAQFPGLITRVEAGEKFSEQEKIVYFERFKTVVDHVQINQLQNIVDLLDDILDDPQNVYFVLVDHLDEKWVDDRFKTRLIRALLETMRRFRSVENLRIVIALRYDLFDRVLSDTQAGQQQEDKLHALSLQIRWTKNQLTELLDSRINRLVKQRYTTRPVTHADILPESMPEGGKRKNTMDWILARTFMRPRDIIQFFNFAIAKAVDEPVLSEDALLEAEGEYSRERMAAIRDEYIVIYPNLLHFVEILYRLPERVHIGALTDMSLLEGVENALAACNGTQDQLQANATAFRNGDKPLDEFRRDLFSTFYEVGIVGLQKAPGEPISWTYQTRRSLSRAEITNETRAYIHPMFWRRLATRTTDEPLIEA
mgnify:CR=1 FL=1